MASGHLGGERSGVYALGEMDKALLARAARRRKVAFEALDGSISKVSGCFRMLPRLLEGDVAYFREASGSWLSR